MNQIEVVRAREDVPTGELIREALTEGRQLAATELEIAKRELRREVYAAVEAGVASTAAIVMATVGLTMCFVGLSMAVTSWVLALCIGGGFLVLAAGVGLFAYARMPKKVLPVTTRNVLEDVRRGAERLV